MAEITADLLADAGLPESILVVREQVAIPVSERHWQNLRAELGLDRSAVRDLVREILDTQLRRRTARLAPLLPAGETLAERTGVRLLGFVLFACHIDQLAESGLPRQFGY